MSSDWESWDWDTVHREVDPLGLLDLVGRAEADVRARFGQPDEVVSPGSESADAAGNLVFRADSALLYYGLAPHACISISVANGHVATMSLWPKWKRCPGASSDDLGPLYAAE